MYIVLWQTLAKPSLFPYIVTLLYRNIWTSSSLLEIYRQPCVGCIEILKKIKYSTFLIKVYIVYTNCVSCFKISVISFDNMNASWWRKLPIRNGISAHQLIVTWAVRSIEIEVRGLRDIVFLRMRLEYLWNRWEKNTAFGRSLIRL